MKTAFEISEEFNVDPTALYHAWLDSELHTEMTGGEASCSNQIGENFTAWDGYIWGKNLDLIPGVAIKQAWRTSEFAPEDEDSILELKFSASENGTVLFLRHSNIPDGAADYETGWIEHYFEPMLTYFK